MPPTIGYNFSGIVLVPFPFTDQSAATFSLTAWHAPDRAGALTRVPPAFNTEEAELIRIGNQFTQAVGELFGALDEIEAMKLPPMSEEEIQAEIDAARRAPGALRQVVPGAYLYSRNPRGSSEIVACHMYLG